MLACFLKFCHQTFWVTAPNDGPALPEKAQSLMVEFASGVQLIRRVLEARLGDPLWHPRRVTVCLEKTYLCMLFDWRLDGPCQEQDRSIFACFCAIVCVHDGFPIVTDIGSIINVSKRCSQAHKFVRHARQ